MALVVGLALAPVAMAAPDRTITISGANPFVSFDGVVTDFSAVTGNTPGSDIVIPGPGWDETVIKVETGGRLAVKTTSDGAPTSEIDLQLFKSDAAGTRGDEIAAGLDAGAEERVQALVKDGYYLLVASGYPAVNAAFKGEVRLVIPEQVPAVTPPTGPVGQPQAKPPTKKKLSCKQKARRIKKAKKRKAAMRKCAKRS